MGELVLTVLTLKSLVPDDENRSKLIQSSENYVLLKGKQEDKVTESWEIIGFK